MRKINRRQFIGGSAAAVALTTLKPGMSFAASGDTLTIRAPGDIDTVDPGFWKNTTDLWVMDAVFPRLINFKSGSKWEWELYSAESINQRDALTIDFKLKPGSMWTNGYGELTTADVKFSFERYLDKELATETGDNWALLDHVEIHDKYSGSIHLREAFAPLWWFVLPYATGSILCKAAVEKSEGRKFTLEPPAMGGAYKIVEHMAGQRLVLEAHDGCAGRSHTLDELRSFQLPIPRLLKMLCRLDKSIGPG